MLVFAFDIITVQVNTFPFQSDYQSPGDNGGFAVRVSEWVNNLGEEDRDTIKLTHVNVGKMVRVEEREPSQAAN